MRVDWCVSSWFRIKNTHSLTHSRLAVMCVYVCVCACFPSGRAILRGRSEVGCKMNKTRYRTLTTYVSHFSFLTPYAHIDTRHARDDVCVSRSFLQSTHHKHRRQLLPTIYLSTIALYHLYY